MTASAIETHAEADLGRYFVLGTVTLATMLFAMAVTNSYVVLPQMQGTLSATQDQIAWTVTFNLMAASCSGAWPTDRRNGSQRSSSCSF